MNDDDTFSFTTALGQDHQRLDALLEEAAQHVRDGDLTRATLAFSTFRDGLARHIRFEEEAVFPAFEERTGMRGGPTTVMRAEHREILAELENMGGALVRQQPDRFEEARAALVETLEAHNYKEEQILYPMADRVVTTAERRALLETLEP